MPPDPVRVLILAPVAFVASSAHATEYLSLPEAQKLMFPDATSFEPREVRLTAAELKDISERSSGPSGPAHWSVFSAKKDHLVLGYVIADMVLGKFQFIDYAVAFDPQGAVRDVEILSYRESHGGEVRSKAWRAQFQGKTGQAALQVGQDIRNISGATLSCTHLTDGIRRLAAYARLLVARP